jgi:hypothetical protein
MLKIISKGTGANFYVDQAESIRFELAINVSSKAYQWSHVGDFLYQYGSQPDKEEELVVSDEQFVFLTELREKTLTVVLCG